MEDSKVEMLCTLWEIFFSFKPDLKRRESSEPKLGSGSTGEDSDS